MVRPSYHKGINYFDVNYHRGGRWYAAHFPLSSRIARRAPAEFSPPLPFEASGYYVWHPTALRRIADDLPEVKLVLMLRDPMERAYSAWKHESARGFETEPFVRALRLEASRLEGELERMTSDERYESHAYRHLAYAARSDYTSQLRRVYSSIPKDRVHVVYSEEFFSQPHIEMARLERFLGAQPYDQIVFEQHNARPSGSMPEEARSFLLERLAETYASIADLVGRPAPWAR